jgi:hypothetical protein
MQTRRGFLLGSAAVVGAAVLPTTKPIIFEAIDFGLEPSRSVFAAIQLFWDEDQQIMRRKFIPLEDFYISS